MSLIKPKKEVKIVSQKINISDEILEAVNAYCGWAGITEINDFFVGAAEHILKTDKGWQKHKKVND